MTRGGLAWVHAEPCPHFVLDLHVPRVRGRGALVTGSDLSSRRSSSVTLQQAPEVTSRLYSRPSSGTFKSFQPGSLFCNHVLFFQAQQR